MGKFTKYGGAGNWDKTLKEVEGLVLVVHNLTPVKTQYGPTYVLHCDVSDGKKTTETNVKVLSIGQVCKDSLDTFLENSQEADDRFPFSVLVSPVYLDDKLHYWRFLDAEET